MVRVSFQGLLSSSHSGQRGSLTYCSQADHKGIILWLAGKCRARSEQSPIDLHLFPFHWSELTAQIVYVPSGVRIKYNHRRRRGSSRETRSLLYHSKVFSRISSDSASSLDLTGSSIIARSALRPVIAPPTPAAKYSPPVVVSQRLAARFRTHRVSLILKCQISVGSCYAPYGQSVQLVRQGVRRQPMTEERGNLLNQKGGRISEV